MSKRELFRWFVSLLGTLFFGGGIAPVYSEDLPPREDTVVFDLVRPLSSTPNFNWFVREGWRENGAHQAMWEPLFQLNYQTGELEPWLGQSIEPDAAFRVWTLTLRPFVAWSNGKPFSAHDVQFTVELAQNHPELPAMEAATLGSQIKEVKVLDNCKVEITLKESNPRFALENFGGALFSAFLIMPKEIWGPEQPKPAVFTFKNPIGTGPYTLDKEFTTTTEVVWRRNNDWWGAQTPEQLAKSKVFGPKPDKSACLPAPGAAKPDPKMPVFKPLPAPLALKWVVVDSQAQSRALLEKNELDAGQPLTLENFNQARAENSNIVGWDPASNRAWRDPCPRQLEINTQLEWRPKPGDNPLPNPWSDKRLRRALSLLIDRTELARQVYDETTVPSKTMFAEYGAMEKVIAAVTAAGLGLSPTADLAGAETLLKEAGYEKNVAGRFQKVGETLTATILVDRSSTQDLAAVRALAGQLDNFGIGVTVAEQEHDLYWGHDIVTGHYQMTYNWLSCGSVAEPYTSMARYTKDRYVDEGERSPGFDNTGRWNTDATKSYSNLVSQLDQLPPGAANAPTLAVEAYKFLADDMPFIPLVQSPELVPFNTKFWVGWPSASNPANVPRHDWHSTHRLIHLLKKTGAL